jgi:type III secretory pathway component EscU
MLGFVVSACQWQAHRLLLFSKFDLSLLHVEQLQALRMSKKHLLREKD